MPVHKDGYRKIKQHNVYIYIYEETSHVHTLRKNYTYISKHNKPCFRSKCFPTSQPNQTNLKKKHVKNLDEEMRSQTNLKWMDLQLSRNIAFLSFDALQETAETRLFCFMFLQGICKTNLPIMNILQEHQSSLTSFDFIDATVKYFNTSTG